MTVGRSRTDGRGEIFIEKFNLHSIMQTTALKIQKGEVEMNPKNRYVVLWMSLNWFRVSYILLSN